MNKLITPCCGTPAKVNMSGTSAYFCGSCGNDCDPKEARNAPRKTLSTVRKPSGEVEVFKTLWAQNKGRSEVSGKALPPPGHPMFHWTGSHLLAKGRYPDYKLDPRNIVMVTPEEHQLWTDNGPEGLRYSHGWTEIVRRFDKLKAEAERKYQRP